MAQEPRYTSYNDPRDSRYPSYDDPFAEPVDLDAFGAQLRSHHSNRSVATRQEYLPDDAVPLFLSDPDDIPRPPKFGSARKRGSSRLLKTGVFAIAATVATFIAVKNPFTVFANATASLFGMSDVRSTPTPPPAQALEPKAIASVPVLAATAPAQAPSRDEIALALRNASQSQAPADVPPPAAAVAPVVVAAAPPARHIDPAPARRIDPDELAALMTRAKALLASGDISPARLLLERAAEAQEAGAALMLAQTYDPAVLGTQDIRNITPDPAMARKWYQRAAQLGSADAQRRLSQLQ